MAYLINLSAFLLPLAIFFFWGIVGLATLNLLHSRRHLLQNMLLAPALGFAVTLIPIFALNRLGLPALTFSSYLAFALLSLSLFSLWKRGLILPWRLYLPFAGIFLLALLLIGRPLLLFGFDWVSYSNDDMANYSLAALRILKHGFFDLPSAGALAEGKDYSLFYWFMHVPGMVRPGSEMLIALISGITHLSALQTFMPTIVAFHLTMISSLGGLIASNRSQVKVALVACLLLSFSALTVLGTLYQLIAQVAGLSLLLISLVFIFQTFTSHRKFGTLRQGLLIAIVISGLLVIYPEIAPFLGLSMLLYFTWLLFKGWRTNRLFWKTFFFATFFSLLLLNTQLIAALQFLLVQVDYGSSTNLRDIQAAIFPYYLLPSGFANLWGLQTMSIYPKEPRMSLTIMLGIFLTLTTVFLTLRLFFLRAQHFTAVMLVMFLVSINLFMSGFGFGIFKIAMFLQPFFAAVIAISIFELVKDHYKKTLIVLGLILCGAGSLNFYVTRSKAITPGGFSELLFASHTKLNKEFRQGLSKFPADAIFLSDDFNVSLIKFLAYQSEERNFHPLVSPIFFLGFFLAQEDVKNKLLEDISSKYFLRHASNEITENYLEKQYHMAHFNLPHEKNATLDFLQYNREIDAKHYNERSVLVSDGPLRIVLNRFKHHHLPPQNFYFKSYAEIKNHLVFIDAKQGAAYNSLLQAKDITPTPSFFNLEGDWFYPGKTIQGVGRYLLFRVLNPEREVRMVINLTNSLEGNGINKLPEARVIGDKVVSFDLVGRGSARVFSEPLTPQMVQHLPYLALDLNKEGKKFPSSRFGLMQLYGDQIALDLRKIVSFARDISIISENEYQNLHAPYEIKQFPSDFTNPQLAYSGFYEDGFVSEEAYVKLSQPHPHYQLVIKGSIPKIHSDFVENEITVFVDGKPLLQKSLPPGPFKLKEVVQPSDQALRKVTLQFSHTQALHRDDRRPVAARIHYLGFTAS